MEAARTRDTIVGFYKKAIYCYLAPVGMALLGFALPDFIGAACLLLLLPSGIAGLIFTQRGWALSRRSGDREKKDVGYANFLLGIIISVLGLGALAIVAIL